MAHGSLQKRIALRIRSARQAARLTQSELAAALALSRSAVAQWESASGSAPSTASFARLATTLGCTFEWLATGHGPRSAAHPTATDGGDDVPAVCHRHFAHNEEEERMIEAFRPLDDFDRAAVMALTETLSARPPARNAPAAPARRRSGAGRGRERKACRDSGRAGDGGIGSAMQWDGTRRCGRNHKLATSMKHKLAAPHRWR